MREKPRIKNQPEIEKLSIPDDDRDGWRETLFRLGWSEQFVDSFLSNLSQSYSGDTRRLYKLMDRLEYYDKIAESRDLSEIEQREYEQALQDINATAKK